LLGCDGCGHVLVLGISQRCTRSSHEKAVCLSIRLSVKRVICDKTEESSVQIFMPYQRSFILVF